MALSTSIADLVRTRRATLTGTWVTTHGMMRNRVLYAMKRTFRLRASADQPMKRSRGPRCRGAEHHARQAIGLAPAKTMYFRCSPTGRV